MVVTSEGGAGSLGARLERSRRFSGAPRGDCSWDGRREAALWASLADRAGSDVRRQTRVDVGVDVGLVAGQGRAPGLKLRRRSNSANIQQTETYLRGKGTNEQKPGTTQIEHQSMHKNEGVSCAC